MRMAVASSADRTKVEINLKAIGASPIGRYRAFRQPGEKKETVPDIYHLRRCRSAFLRGLSRRGGCSERGAAAKAAGCFCCGVTGTFDAETLARAGADVVVTSLDAFRFLHPRRIEQPAGRFRFVRYRHDRIWGSQDQRP